MKQYALKDLPERRVHPKLQIAAQHLLVAHTTLQGIFASLHVLRLARAAEAADHRGRMTGSEVDLLRSAIVLGGAGLDAVLRRVARDGLPMLLATDSTYPVAGRYFRAHVSEQIRNKAPSTSWTQAVLDQDPRQAMIRLYIEEKTSGSFQNEKQMKALRDALGIAPFEVTDEQIANIGPFLLARNRVAHDLDLKDPDDASWGNRYSHQSRTIITQCNAAIDLAGDYLDAVSLRLGGPPRRGRRPAKKITALPGSGLDAGG